jgi:hypothetical protein
MNAPYFLRLQMSVPTSAELTAMRDASRKLVKSSYETAEAENSLNFLKGDDKATAEYIFPNQKEDAKNIVEEFYRNNCRVVSVQKKTKVGADGLMIESATLLTTHEDPEFAVNYANVRILTGMSNAGWEKDMKDKAPSCFKDKIFHHGQLSKADLRMMRNSLLIIDEIDSGDKEGQVLHTILKEAGVLDVRHMEEHNNRFIFISATMIKELYQLYQWGSLHKLYKMTIPASYIGHNDFLQLGIIKEFYSLQSKENAEKWVQEDILDNYGPDYRVHIVRLNPKTVKIVEAACIRKGILFRNHTSTDRLTKEEQTEFFKEALPQHIVLGVKGFFRRANLIPNRWKLRIGATHELCVKNVDNNVQVQGLPGRISGYWRDDIERGHKTGPHRTSIKAIKEYEATYLDPFGENSYKTAGFNKKKGKVTSESTMLSAKNIPGLHAVDLPTVKEEVVNIKTYRIYSDMNIAKDVCMKLYKKFTKLTMDTEGFAITSYHADAKRMTLTDAVKLVPKSYGLEENNTTGRRGRRICLPCYVDTNDNTTIRFVVIIHPDIVEIEIAECDAKYTSLTLENAKKQTETSVQSSHPIQEVWNNPDATHVNEVVEEPSSDVTSVSYLFKMKKPAVSKK